MEDEKKTEKACPFLTLDFFLSPFPPSLHKVQRDLCRGTESYSLTGYLSILLYASSSVDLCFKIRGARLLVKDEITEDN